MQQSLSLTHCQNCHTADPSSQRPAKIIALGRLSPPSNGVHLGKPSKLVGTQVPGAQGNGRDTARRIPFWIRTVKKGVIPGHPSHLHLELGTHLWGADPASPAPPLQAEFNQYLPAPQSCRVKMKKRRQNLAALLPAKCSGQQAAKPTT